MINPDRKEITVNEQRKTKADPLFLFFFITLAWTWIIGFIPLWCGIAETALADILFKALVGPAPTIVGLIMVFVLYTRKQQITHLQIASFLNFDNGIIIHFIAMIVQIYAVIAHILNGNIII